VATLHAGDPAPDFTLLAQDGAQVTLSSLRGRPVVLIFYPMDQTPGCTAQLCAARDDADRYAAAGVDVFGVNNGSAASHERFVAKHSLRTPLLVDAGLNTAAAYDAVIGLGKLRIINRTVVGISPSGTISYYKRGAPSTDAILAAVAPA
jgi:peroxiredoxin Q/BCP